jgi:hypothetical protein
MVTIDGTSYDATVTNDRWSLNLTPEQITNLPEGSVSVIFSATDAARNITIVSISVLVNLTAPFVTIDPVFGNGTLTHSKAQAGATISGTVDSAFGVMTVSIDGNLVSQLYDGDQGSWSLPMSPDVLTPLIEGPHEMTVTVTDVIGNSSTQSTPFFVEPALT